DNVTPKPLTGSRKLGTAGLLRTSGVARVVPGATSAALDGMGLGERAAGDGDWRERAGGEQGLEVGDGERSGRVGAAQRLLLWRRDGAPSVGVLRDAEQQD